MDKTWIMPVTELLFLYLCAREDYQSRKLSVLRFQIFGSIGIAEFFLVKPYGCQSLMAGVGIGIVILFFAYVSGGKIGEGDGWLFFITGIYSGGGGNLVLLILSGWLCAAVVFWGILRKKYRKNDKVAYAPFVFVAQVIWLCLV